MGANSASRTDRGVFFKVFETKCPSAQPKKRGAGKDVTAAYNSKFPRPSAQVHTRKRGANDAVPDTTGRALGHLLSKVSNYIFNSYRERGAWTRARRGIFSKVLGCKCTSARLELCIDYDRVRIHGTFAGNC